MFDLHAVFKVNVNNTIDQTYLYLHQQLSKE